ncbi:MAG: TIGR02147 family protein [Bdellovibrionales bacterium]|nr:TIGR02147 family protein [Bdellovibrionales bacterium]
MSDSIYSHSDYKRYLIERTRVEGHGARQRLAQAIACQAAYVSHVLNGDRHLSVDQAEAVARHFALGSDETEYFVWLVEWARAGTPGARRLFARLLEQKRTQSLQLKKRVNISEELSDADKAIYYGSYIYSAVHMLVTIPKYRTVESIAQRLAQPSARIVAVLDFLTSRQLVTERAGKFEAGSRYLFIDKESSFVLQHHSNWRLQAMQNAAKRSGEDLHLSLVVTLSEEDAQSLRQRVAEFVSEISGKIKESKEERLMNLNLDFFEV